MEKLPRPPQECIDDLRNACKGYGNLKQFVMGNGVSNGAMCSYLTGNVPIINKVLNPVGWERVIIYRRIEK